MDQTAFVTGETPDITITAVGGDLSLSGWMRDQFQAEAGGSSSLTAEQNNDRIVLACSSDCVVRVPRRARVRILQVSGGARLKSLEGPVEFQRVAGNLVLRQAGAVIVGRVSGNVNAKKIHGPLRVHSAGGDVSVRSIAGEFAAEDVSGDLYLRDAQAGARVRVTGDAILTHVAFAAPHPYDIEAAGKIICRVLADTSARLTIQSGGEVFVNVPGVQVEEDAGRQVVILGDGTAQVALRAVGDVSVTALTPEFDDMIEFVQDFDRGIGTMADNVAARIRQSAGPQSAQRKAEASRRRAGAKAEAAGRRVEPGGERGRANAPWPAWGFAPARQAKSPPASNPVSDDERVIVLRMVGQGKITVDEAEQLLAALESAA